VAAYIRTLDLPVTILHPTAFMELMTEPKFFPAASTWHLMPKLMGSARPVGWLTVGNLAVIVATAFGDPDRFIGREVMLASDVQLHRCVPGHLAPGDGSAAPAIPDARWLFERFAGTDETTMWRWLGANEVNFDTGPTLAIHPEALTVREWLRRKKAAGLPRRQGRGSA
jgi:hypothetical protein